MYNEASWYLNYWPKSYSIFSTNFFPNSGYSLDTSLLIWSNLALGISCSILTKSSSVFLQSWKSFRSSNYLKKYVFSLLLILSCNKAILIAKMRLNSGALESWRTEVTRVLWSLGIRFFWKNFKSISTTAFPELFAFAGLDPFFSLLDTASWARFLMTYLRIYCKICLNIFQEYVTSFIILLSTLRLKNMLRITLE